ncbi:MAG: hypothetical protein ACOC9T_03200 [Myxococcota bacterium]
MVTLSQERLQELTDAAYRRGQNECVTPGCSDPRDGLDARCLMHGLQARVDLVRRKRREERRGL